MTQNEMLNIINSPEYDFLRTNPHLGDNIMFLTLGGSHAYGTNIEGSDIDIRGVTANSRQDILGLSNFEQVLDEQTDTTVYGFRKLISLLMNCNPNVIEMLGGKSDNYAMVSRAGKTLLDNKKLFLSKKAIYSFGGYANDQLRRLQLGLLQHTDNTALKEQFAQRSVQRVVNSFKTLGKDTDFEVFIGKPAGNTEEELLVNVNLSNYPLRELKSLIKASNAAVAQFDTMGKRNKKKDEKHLNKHAMHLVRLYLMAFDILEKGEINTYRDKDHNLLMSIRNGAYMNTDGSFKQDFFEMVDGYEKRLQYDSKNTELPDNPDFEQVQELVMTINAMTLGIAEQAYYSTV